MINKIKNCGTCDHCGQGEYSPCLGRDCSNNDFKNWSPDRNFLLKENSDLKEEIKKLKKQMCEVCYHKECKDCEHGK